jgi:hypothetical protein
MESAFANAEPAEPAELALTLRSLTKGAEGDMLVRVGILTACVVLDDAAVESLLPDMSVRGEAFSSKLKRRLIKNDELLQIHELIN